MPRSPNDIVVKDSGAILWCAVADGVVESIDLSPDGKLRPSLTSEGEWAKQTAANLPFNRQVPPKPSGGRPPLGDCKDVQLAILRAELRAEEIKRIASEKREKALRKAVDGLCQWHTVARR